MLKSRELGDHRLRASMLIASRETRLRPLRSRRSRWEHLFSGSRSLAVLSRLSHHQAPSRRNSTAFLCVSIPQTAAMCASRLKTFPTRHLQSSRKSGKHKIRIVKEFAWWGAYPRSRQSRKEIPCLSLRNGASPRRSGAAYACPQQTPWNTSLDAKHERQATFTKGSLTSRAGLTARIFQRYSLDLPRQRLARTRLNR